MQEGKVDDSGSRYKTYVAAAILGAIGGGLFVLFAARMMSRMMSGRMRKMMAQMRASGCDPAEM
jgi:hypothetical protein